MQKTRQQQEEEKKKIKSEYEAKMKILEDKLAEEIRKMQDSNGYLKKMYE